MLSVVVISYPQTYLTTPLTNWKKQAVVYIQVFTHASYIQCTTSGDKSTSYLPSLLVIPHPLTHP